MPARLVQVTLRNNSSFPLHWKTDHLDHGDWQDPWYPSRISNLGTGQEGAWRSESGGFLTGTEGWAVFTIDVPGTTEFARIHWSRPYVGNFGFDFAVTRFDPTAPSGGSTFVDTSQPLTRLTPFDLGALGSDENLVGKFLSAGIITPFGYLWSAAEVGHHVRLGLALSG